MTQPQMPRGVIDLGKMGDYAHSPRLALPGNEPAPTGPPCSKCGHPMPELPPELASVAATQAVVLAHEVCPGETVLPDGRYFEVRVQIVEITDTTTPASDGIDRGINGSPAQMAARAAVHGETLIEFKSGGRWPDLDTAMRPLAGLLGEKWMAAEKQAKLADLDPVTGKPR